MDWKEPDMFEAGSHGNKPFGIRFPSLVVTRGIRTIANGYGNLKKTLTYDLLLERGEFVMSAPSDKMMDVVVFGGYVLGHVDKWQAAG